MKSPWQILFALLIISLAFNVLLSLRFFRSDSHNSADSVESIFEERSDDDSHLTSVSLPTLNESITDTGRPGLESLMEAGLTREESVNILVSLINTRYEDEKKELLTIRDPMLTTDEIYVEGQKRFVQLAEADRRRRHALEAATGGSWTRADFDVGWSKPGLFFLVSGVLATSEIEKVPDISNTVISALRDITFANSDPFDIKRPANAAALKKILIRQEREMRAVLSGAEIQEYFKPLVSMTFYDVFGMQRRFGRELSEKENDRLLTLLAPELPLSLFDESSGLTGRGLPERVMPEIRKVVGENSFAHHLKAVSELDRSSQVHLQVFDIEQQFKAECENSGASLESPPQDLLESYHESMAALLGEDLPKYIVSPRGAWLTPAVSGL